MSFHKKGAEPMNFALLKVSKTLGNSDSRIWKCNLTCLAGGFELRAGQGSDLSDSFTSIPGEFCHTLTHDVVKTSRVKKDKGNSHLMNVPEIFDRETTKNKSTRKRERRRKPPNEASFDWIVRMHTKTRRKNQRQTREQRNRFIETFV